MGAEASIDELTVGCHEHDIELGGIELLPSIFLAVVQKALSLLEHRDCECLFVEVNSFI